MAEENITSGFVDEDINPNDIGNISNVVEFYSSNSGVSRLLQGKRYGKLCVIKTLKKSHCGDTFSEQILRKEFAIGYQLSHPHICRTEGWEQFPNLGNCILMEYIDGISLHECIKQKRLTKQLAYKWINELCQALDYLHSKQIIHRDLKPENILVTHNGNNIKLIDFSLSDQDDFDVLKSPAGTRYYLAPEMLSENGKVDLRADIYSLGVIIGEMATILNDNKLAAISRKCTKILPEKRYASDLQVIEALNNRSYPIISWGWVAAVVLMVVCGYFYFPTYKKSDVIQLPVYTNISINERCMDLLRMKRIQLKQQNVSSVEDSLQLISELKKCMEEVYPLPKQQQTESYKRQWEYLLQEVEDIYSSTMLVNNPQ